MPACQLLSVVIPASAERAMALRCYARGVMPDDAPLALRYAMIFTRPPFSLDYAPPYYIAAFF